MWQHNDDTSIGNQSQENDSVPVDAMQDDELVSNGGNELKADEEGGRQDRE